MARPRLDPGIRLRITFSVSLTQAQKIKFIKLGGSKWLREQINKAKEPK